MYLFNAFKLFLHDFKKYSYCYKYYKKWYLKRQTKKFNKFLRNNNECSLYIGLPGSGKTTYIAYLTKLALDTGHKVYCNVPIAGALPYSKEDIGKYDMSGSREKPTLVLLDEAGIMYDNRQFKDAFTDESLTFLKLIRHYNAVICLFSQSMDIDNKWVRLSKTIFFVRKSILYGYTSLYKVKRTLDVNPDTHKIEDFYDKADGLLSRIFHFRFRRKPYYHMFDSWSAPKLKAFPNIPKYKPYEFIKGSK